MTNMFPVFSTSGVKPAQTAVPPSHGTLDDLTQIAGSWLGKPLMCPGRISEILQAKRAMLRALSPGIKPSIRTGGWG